MADLVAQERVNLGQSQLEWFLDLDGFAIYGLLIERCHELPKPDQRFTHLARRQGEVDDAGMDGGLGHLGVPWRGAVADLGHGYATVFLDDFQAKRAVGIGTGKNDAHRALACVDGKRTQENVDQLALPMFVLVPQLQVSLLDAEDCVGRQHVDMIALDFRLPAGDLDRQRRIARHDFVQQAFTIRA